MTGEGGSCAMASEGDREVWVETLRRRARWHKVRRSVAAGVTPRLPTSKGIGHRPKRRLASPLRKSCGGLDLSKEGKEQLLTDPEASAARRVRHHGQLAEYGDS